MAIIIERTITIKNNIATLDRPLYLYIGDGDITCLFTIEEKTKAARFGSITTTNSITENASYGEVRIYKPDPGSDSTSRLESTNRAEIIDDKLQVVFSYKNIDDFSEAGVHKLQIHLYDDDDSERNRFTIPPIEINVLLPVGYDNNSTDEALVDYSLLDARGVEVTTFDEEGNYNKTVWRTGDIITSNKLNKLEEALYEINAADSNFVTIEVLETELNNKADKAHSHSAANISGLATVAKSGSYNDLSNKPNMSSYATKTELANKANTTHTHNEYANATHTHNGYASSSHNHDEYYASAADVIGKADKVHTHSNYLTQDALSNYATKSYVDNQGFITSIPSAYITESELQTKLADKAYATISYVDVSIKNAGGFSGGGGSSEGLDLTIYATKDQLNTGLATKANTEHTHAYLVNVPDKYATKDYVNEAISEAQLGGGSINPEDLADYYTKDQIDVKLTSKSNTNHSHDDLYAPTTHTHDMYALKSDIPNINEVTVPENISYFNNDVGYITNDNMNDALSNKADTDHTHDDYALKTNIPTVPTNVSAFTNDAGYVTSNSVIRIEIVTALPETEEEGVLYIVKE